MWIQDTVSLLALAAAQLLSPHGREGTRWGQGSQRGGGAIRVAEAPRAGFPPARSFCRGRGLQRAHVSTCNDDSAASCSLTEESQLRSFLPNTGSHTSDLPPTFPAGKHTAFGFTFRSTMHAGKTWGALSRVLHLFRDQPFSTVPGAFVTSQWHERSVRGSLWTL